MRKPQESFSLLENYLGFDRRALLIFALLACGVLVVVTVIYIANSGFQTWQTNMERAGSMMIANFNQGVPNQAARAVQPGATAPNARVQVPVAPRAPCQYQCPNCGARRSNVTPTWADYECGGSYTEKGQIQNHTRLWWGKCNRGEATDGDE